MSLEERNENIANLNMQFQLLRHHRSTSEAYMEIIQTRAYSMVCGLNYNSGPSIPTTTAKATTTVAITTATITTTTTTTTTCSPRLSTSKPRLSENFAPEQAREEAKGKTNNEEEEEVDQLFRDSLDDDDDLSCSILARPSRLSRKKRSRSSVATLDSETLDSATALPPTPRKSTSTRSLVPPTPSRTITPSVPPAPKVTRVDSGPAESATSSSPFQPPTRLSLPRTPPAESNAVRMIVVQAKQKEQRLSATEEAFRKNCQLLKKYEEDLASMVNILL